MNYSLSDLMLEHRLCQEESLAEETNTPYHSPKKAMIVGTWISPIDHSSTTI